jgi:hypothetical protein
MEPKGFPYEPFLLTFALGIMFGVWRGMQARAKELLPSVPEQLAKVRGGGEQSDKP